MTIEPIGFVHTDVHDKYHAPRQPNSVHDMHLHTANNSRAVIELLPQCNYDQALADLEGFSRIWIIFSFHRNHGWKPKVHTPRSRTKYGVFATRSPHRPNNLGLSTVELLGIDRWRMYIGAHDLLDGTPVFDIKPYIPLYDSFPDTKTGWFDAEMRTTQIPVVVSALAEHQHTWLAEHGIDVLSHVKPTLTTDPYPHSYKRVKAHPDGFMIAWKSWRVVYAIEEIDSHTRVTILRIESGYTREAIATAQNNNAPETLHDGSAHWKFLHQFY